MLLNPQPSNDVLVELQDVIKTFPVQSGIWGRVKDRVHAVSGVSLKIRRGETMGLVGESGCGKSTLGHLILRLLTPDRGRIIFDGIDISHLPERKLRALRHRMQIIFQDPYASLNPRMRVGHIIEEPLIIHRRGGKKERQARVRELLHRVGLSEEAASRYPHEFSGGQRQRIGIARALALDPSLLIADEPVSALDVSIRGEIVNLLLRLQKELGLSLLFISHDLNVVQHISHQVAVMYLGKIMEVFPVEAFSQARHPYTQALVSSIPIPRPGAKKERIVLPGDVPSPLIPPTGCRFHPRCRYAQPVCSEREPLLEPYLDQLSASCHFIGEMAPVGRRLA